VIFLLVDPRRGHIISAQRDRPGERHDSDRQFVGRH
jgi:hypothetical protein